MPSKKLSYDPFYIDVNSEVYKKLDNINERIQRESFQVIRDVNKTSNTKFKKIATKNLDGFADILKRSAEIDRQNDDIEKKAKKIFESKDLHDKIKKSVKNYHDKFTVLSTTQQKVFVDTNSGVNSIVNTRFQISKISFIVTYANFITSGCMNLLNDSKNKAQLKHYGGINIFIKFLLNDVLFNDKFKEVKYRSFVVKGNNISHADIYNKIHSEASRMYDNPNYYLVTYD